MRQIGDLKDNEIREKLKKIKVFCLDMDGTFYLGDNVITGSMEFLDKLKSTGRDFLFLTNNSSRSVSHYAEKLRKLGLETDENHILSSGQAAAQYLNREHPGKTVYLLGNLSLTAEMEAHGITLNENDPDLVLVGFDTTLDYAKMTKVCDFIREGKPYIATHPDFNCPTATGFIPDIGAIMAFIEASTGRKADLIIGKPYGEIVKAACERTNLRPEEMAMVGDRLYTDVRTGVDHGLCAVLVLSGEGVLSDIDKFGIEPDLIFEKLGDMIPYLD